MLSSHPSFHVPRSDWCGFTNLHTVYIDPLSICLLGFNISGKPPFLVVVTFSHYCPFHFTVVSSIVHHRRLFTGGAFFQWFTVCYIWTHCLLTSHIWFVHLFTLLYDLLCYNIYIHHFLAPLNCFLHISPLSCFTRLFVAAFHTDSANLFLFFCNFSKIKKYIYI